MKIEKAMKERVSHVNEYITTTFSIAQWLSIRARREFEGLTFDSSWLPKMFSLFLAMTMNYIFL